MKTNGKTGFTIRHDTLLKIFVIIIIALWSNGFNLSYCKLSNKYEVLNLIAQFLILVVAGISVLIAGRYRYFRNYYFWFIVCMFVSIIIPTFCNLVISNGLGFVEVLRSIINYIGLLIFIPLLFYVPDSSFVLSLNKIILRMSYCNVIFLIFISFVPETANSVLVQTFERFDRIRLVVPNVLSPMVQYSLFFVIVAHTRGFCAIKNKFLNLMLIFIFIWYFFVVEVSRRTIFVLLIVMVYYFLFHICFAKKSKIILCIFTILFLLLMSKNLSFVFGQIGSSYTSSVEEFQYGEGNVGIRVRGIYYYMQLFRESGYLGIGQPSNRLRSTNAYLIGQADYHYNPNDHGIFSVLYRFGFLGIGLTVMFLIHIFRDLKVIRRHSALDYQVIAMAMHLFLIFSIISMLQVFWKPSLSLWTGLMFFMIFRMRSVIHMNDLMST